MSYAFVTIIIINEGMVLLATLVYYSFNFFDYQYSPFKERQFHNASFCGEGWRSDHEVSIAMRNISSFFISRWVLWFRD